MRLGTPILWARRRCRWHCLRPTPWPPHGTSSGTPAAATLNSPYVRKDRRHYVSQVQKRLCVSRVCRCPLVLLLVGVSAWMAQRRGGGEQVEYAELTGVLRVHVHGARRLRLGKGGVAPNPYIKVRVSCAEGRWVTAQPT
jgi:hypothetical protein